MDILLLLLFYGLALVSGVMVAAGSGIRPWLGRILIILAVAAAQILVLTQILSLFHQLREIPLLAADAACTMLTMLALRFAGASGVKDWHLAPWNLGGFFRENPVAALMLVAALGSAILFEVLRAQVAPYGDSYHFAMPLFWRQHASILPFPCTNPRVTGLSFGAEALSFPVFLFARSWAMYSILTILTKFVTLWIVVDLARRLGASLGAAICAGAIFLAYSPMLYASSDLLLATLWMAAAIYLLLESRSDEVHGARILGFSIFCLLMGCGAKNIVSIQAPLFLLLVLWVWGRRLLAWPGLRSVLLGGVLGAICSTVLWMYTSNIVWFGDPRGPKDLKATLSRDFRPRPVWTRIVRASVGSLLDPMWLPGGWQETYANTLQKSVRVLGGADQLDEDDVYYAFIREALRPGTGMNPLGLLLFAPSLAGAFLLRRRSLTLPGDRQPVPRLAVSLALFTIASLLLGFTMLRTQRAGVIRLLCTCLVAGAPLGALLLEKRWVRTLALAAQAGILAMFTIYNLGNIVRRSTAEPPSWLTTQIRKLQRDHTVAAACKWSDRPAETLTMREDFSTREEIQLALSRIPGPTTFGSLSSFNAEDNYLFGPQFTNRVVCLLDTKDSAHALPVPPEVEYLVSDQGEFADLDYAALGFSVWLEIRRADWPPFVVLKRDRKPAAD